MQKTYKKYLPVQKGDKDIFLKQCSTCGGTEYQADYCSKCMTTTMVDISFSECTDIKIVMLKDLSMQDKHQLIYYNDGYETLVKDNFSMWYNQQMQEHGINTTYEQDIKDGKYIVLAEFKR